MFIILCFALYFHIYIYISKLHLQGQRSNSSSGIERHSSYHSNSSSSEDLNREPAWLQGPDWANRHASVTSEEEL